MRYLVIFTLLVTFATAALAEKDAQLSRFLSLLSTVHMGDDYESVKKLLPEIEALKKDAGENNTEAVIKMKIGKIALRGEFNFSNGHLISHGFSTGELAQPEAHDFLLRCIGILENLHGPGSRTISLPSESDGPTDSIGISFNWHEHRTLMGLDFNYRRNFSTISWGAQGE